MPQPRQPFLHDLVPLIAAPTQIWSDRVGDIDPGHGAHGVLHADVRMLSALELRVDGEPAEHLATATSLDDVHFSYLLRGLDQLPVAADPALRLDRRRRVRPGLVEEKLRVTSVLAEPIQLGLSLRFAADLAPVEAIKVGDLRPARALTGTGHGGSWTDGTVTATLTADASPDSDAPVVAVGADDLTVSWTISVPARGVATVGWQVALADTGGVVRAARPGAPVAELIERGLALAGPAVAADRRLGPWVEQAFADLAGLRMTTTDDPEHPFYAAGAPWYFTLFGRDSILSARMMLAVDPAMAAGTLVTLARLQGTKVDPAAAEQPGKIMHELRRGTFAFGDITLPPLYYGSVDATPLWICLLHDLWKSGGDEGVVAGLVPALQRALEWLITYGDADGDGFLEYLDPTGHGLANQGWKDSSDAVRFADGRQADGPIALCEVQGYAYEAATVGAELLEAFDRPGGEQYRSWAGELARRFRDEFWCDRDGRRFPALALDGRKQPVDSLTSNIGHLLGTGLLSTEEELVVAELVSGPELDSGLGLRTLAATDGGYSPLSYHCGSVWPHDTAVVIAGLVRSGLTSSALGLVDGLLEASVAFGGRLPELWSGEGRPVPYPMACRPQAWSAAAVVPVLVAYGQLST